MAREPMYYVLWAISWVVIVIVSFVAVIIGVAQLVRLSLLPSYVMSYPVLTISEMQVPWEPDHTVSEYFKLADDDDPSADLRDELGRLKLSALKRRARFEGVDAARLEAAEDADNPKHTIIELIVLASPVADGVEREPSCKSTAGKTCGATHHTPEWFEKRSKAVVDDVASVVGRSLSKLVMKLLSDGLIFAVGYKFMVWAQRIMFPNTEEEFFKGRLNVSLNIIKTGLPEQAPQFQMRTVHECGLEEMFPDKKAKKYIQQYSENCSKKCPFLMVDPRRYKLMKDQIVNRLSMLFGASYINQDLGVQMEDKEYLAVITYEETDATIARKFRVLLLQLDHFESLKNEACPNKTFKFWDQDKGKDFCNTCNKKCGEGPCFFCYSVDRWTNLQGLSVTLNNVSMWDAAKSKFKDPDPSSKELVPLACTLHIACPNLNDKRSGATVLRRIEEVMNELQEIKLQSASDTTSDAGRLTPTTSKGSRGSDFESIRSDGESMLMPTQTEIVSDVNHKNATYR